MIIKIKLASTNAAIPRYGSKGAACFDLHACLEDGPFTLGAHSSASFPTGLAFGIPEGYCLDIRSRSGLAFKNGILAFPGTVDEDFTGEVSVMLTNTTNKSHTFSHGDRIAQAKLTKVNTCAFQLVDELGLTERGSAGFGSTGV